MKKIGVRSAALLTNGEKILLVNHQKDGRSYWVLPGGHVERGETLKEALVREIDEELSLDVTVGPLVIVHDFITDDRHIVNHVFRAHASSTAFHVTPEKTLKAARWVPLAELESVELLPPIADHLRRIVRETPPAPVYLGRK